MIKMLVLQHWFSLSDPELEWQVADRISFRIFLDTTEVVPDFSTVWLFRERLIKSGRFEDLWRELQRQIDEKGFIVKEGSIQDATFITSDPGHARRGALPGAGECFAGDVGTEGARPDAAERAAPGARPGLRGAELLSWWGAPFYGIGLKLYDLLAGKYGFGASKLHQ